MKAKLFKKLSKRVKIKKDGSGFYHVFRKKGDWYDVYKTRVHFRAIQRKHQIYHILIKELGYLDKFREKRKKKK